MVVTGGLREFKRALSDASEEIRTLPEQDPTHALEAARVRRATARIQVAGK